MDTRLDNLESGYHLQVGEVEDFHRRLPKMERVTGGKLMELRNIIVDLRYVHKEQRMLENGRNEEFYVHLK